MEEKRRKRRFRCQTPVLVTHRQGKKWFNGAMFNFSRKGMYIETECNCRPGEVISIVVEEPPYGNGPCLHKARIRWVRELSDAVVFYRYGCGVGYNKTVDYSLNRSSLPIQPRSGNDRRSGRDRRKGAGCRRRDVLADTDGYSGANGF